MNRHSCSRRLTSQARLFRVWIVRFENWRPESWGDVPAHAVVIQPAAEGCFTAQRATAFVRGFNQTALARGQDLWAIRQPINLHYEGDLAPGQRIG